MKYKDILHTIPVPCLLLDRKFRIVFTNKIARELFFKDQDLVKPAPLLHPSLEDSLRKNREQGSFWQSPESGFYYKVTFKEIRDEESADFYLISFLQQEAMPHLFPGAGTNKELEGMPAGSWKWNFDTNQFWWSDEALHIMGFSSSFPIDMESYLSIVHSDDRDTLFASLNRLKETKEPLSLQYRIEYDENPEQVLHITGIPMSDEDGNSGWMIGTVRNITNEAGQIKQNNLTKLVFENMMDGVVVTDPETRIVDVNDAYARIAGYAKEELIGKKVNLIQSGWHSKEFYRRLWDDLNNKGYWKGELWDRRKNGDLYASMTTISEVKNDFGVVTHYVAVSNDITQKKRFDEILHNAAYYDLLTGLPNKLLFSDRASQKLQSYQENDKQLAILILNLDGFRKVNDTLGHHVGDQLLSNVGIILDSFAGKDGLVARIGGDEFSILLDSFTHLSEVSAIAEKIIQEIMKPVEIKGTLVYTGCSIGISVAPNDGDNYLSLHRAAEMAMYEAKETESNTYCFFSGELSRKAEERFRIENYLRLSIDRNELEVYYQPKVSLKTFKVTGLEALVRWKNPALGFVSPGRFIPIAEGSGLIDEIGLFVMQESIRFSNRIRNEHGEVPVISVNVSGKQFLKNNFIDTVNSVLERERADSRYLEFEITESSLMGNVQTVIDTLHQFRRRGISISIDDFGTGYSSMSYLKRFPINKLKIDKSFIDQVHLKQEDFAIVQAIISLAKSLSLHVVAEGVEEEAQVEKLIQLKCDEIQGFYFARPMQANECIDFLKTNDFSRILMKHI